MAPKKKKKPGGDPNQMEERPTPCIHCLPAVTKNANAFCADDLSSASAKCVSCRKNKKGAKKGGCVPIFEAASDELAAFVTARDKVRKNADDAEASFSFLRNARALKQAVKDAEEEAAAGAGEGSA
ncbi:hypothetical protein F4778DRAFT_782573 [Xylariomycetidae sp. FL2044]|nr:hypothetical protein F4778DRAFT_782573 [Xylariomycetidae sp. FL2044]